ncbi:MAG: hypothetical protein HY892_08915 [Deltaproteobacteria bacterium]|nr:hypothetical protein [Deltaproteobacteria bacterium]
MLIDHYLPHYDIQARYAIDIRAPLPRVYEAARRLDLKASRVARTLFRLRGLPETNLALEGMLNWGFVLLADEPEREIVLGLIGRFWVRSPQIESVPAEAFVDFIRPGTAKAVMNLAFDNQPAGTVRLSTETRVGCSDDASRRSFRRYWRLIGPFSGLIRREWLRRIKKQAEAGSGTL